LPAPRLCDGVADDTALGPDFMPTGFDFVFVCFKNPLLRLPLLPNVGDLHAPRLVKFERNETEGSKEREGTESDSIICNHLFTARCHGAPTESQYLDRHSQLRAAEEREECMHHGAHKRESKPKRVRSQYERKDVCAIEKREREFTKE
jgi:hypothetical protein